MKRVILSLLGVLGVAILILVTVYVVRPDPSVGFPDFENRFYRAMDTGHFVIQGAMPVGSTPLGVPLAIRWHPRRWTFKPKPRFALGFSNKGFHYDIIRADSALVDCLVQVLDDRAVLIVLQGRQADKEELNALHDCLEQEFPGLPIDVAFTKDNSK